LRLLLVEVLLHVGDAKHVLEVLHRLGPVAAGNSSGGTLAAGQLGLSAHALLLKLGLADDKLRNHKIENAWKIAVSLLKKGSKKTKYQILHLQVSCFKLNVTVSG
jgi:hypothetical protein